MAADFQHRAYDPCRAGAEVWLYGRFYGNVPRCHPAGAILAVVVLYFHKLWPFCKDNGRDTGFAAHLRWPVVRLWFKIIAACVPAAVLGILLDDWMDAHLYNSVVVALMLIVYGVAFILIERRPRVPTTTKLPALLTRRRSRLAAGRCSP